MRKPYKMKGSEFFGHGSDSPAKQTSGGGNPKFGQKFFSGTKPTIEESEERTDKSGQKWKNNDEKLNAAHLGLV